VVLSLPHAAGLRKVALVVAGLPANMLPLGRQKLLLEGNRASVGNSTALATALEEVR
jgi:hypothetical protein